MRIHRTKLTSGDLRHLAGRIPPSALTSVGADWMRYVVRKPWGTEYLMYRNDFVEIWRLTVNAGQQTSLHCHPNKKTALIMVDGNARFTTLDGTVTLGPLDAAVIDAGAFHQTTAASPQGITLLEVETPPAKHDLLRLRDEYGRTHQAYENPNFWTEDATAARFTEAVREIELATCRLAIETFGAEGSGADHLRVLERYDALVVLAGLISVNQNDTIYNVADIVPIDVIRRRPADARLFNLTAMGVKVAPTASRPSLLQRLTQPRIR